VAGGDGGGATPDTGFLQLEEIFNLEDQLAALESDSNAPRTAT
jgi:hypothetical protein